MQSLRLAAAGRTDAGVHARGQVVSFRLPLLRMTPLQVLRGINGKLGSAAGDIRLVECSVTDPGASGAPLPDRMPDRAALTEAPCIYQGSTQLPIVTQLLNSYYVKFVY